MYNGPSSLYAPLLTVHNSPIYSKFKQKNQFMLDNL